MRFKNGSFAPKECPHKEDGIKNVPTYFQLIFLLLLHFKLKLLWVRFN